MAEADRAGRCPLAAAEEVFPGIPGLVHGECFAEIPMKEADALWRTVERTIDGEVIRKAFASVYRQ